MKVIFLDNDGVICLYSEWGSRFKKTKAYSNPNPIVKNVPVEFRFDNFNKKAIKVLNDILEKTGAEIVVSSDWRHHATLEEIGEYYLSQGIIKKPIGLTTNSLSPDLKYFHPNTDLEETRAHEIGVWLYEHPEVTHWVAIDDLDMSARYGDISGNLKWGLENFVHTPSSSEGIKQYGIKEKIIKFLQ
jgi:hypothetical protein